MWRRSIVGVAAQQDEDVYMVRMLQILATLLVTCAAVASPPLTITESGYYVTTVDASGIPTLEKINSVTDLRTGTPPPVVPDKPVPPAPPKPAPPKIELDLALVKDSTAWAKAIADPLTAQAISLVYDQVGGAYQDGLVDGLTVWTVLKDSTDAAVAVVGSGKDWVQYRTKLSDVITLGRQKGTLAEKQAVLVLLNSLRQGLEMAADGTPSLALGKAVEIATKTNGVIDDSRR